MALATWDCLLVTAASTVCAPVEVGLLYVPLRFIIVLCDLAVAPAIPAIHSDGSLTTAVGAVHLVIEVPSPDEKVLVALPQP